MSTHEPDVQSHEVGKPISPGRHSLTTIAIYTSILSTIIEIIFMDDRYISTSNVWRKIIFLSKVRWKLNFEYFSFTSSMEIELRIIEHAIWSGSKMMICKLTKYKCTNVQLCYQFGLHRTTVSKYKPWCQTSDYKTHKEWTLTTINAQL